MGIFLQAAQGLYNLPEENRGTNPFDGLYHRGLAPARRQHFTPFGSKYDRLKAIAGILGQSEKQLLSSSVFKRAISSAQEVKVLGKGSFGEVKLFRTAIPTQEGPELLEFVRKETQGNVFGLIKEQARVFKQYTGKSRWADAVQIAFKPKEEFFAPYSAGFDLAREAGITRQLAHTEAVPSIYQATKKEMIMEYMPGRTLEQFIKAKQTLPVEARKILEDVAEEAATKGIANLDINARNVLYDPVSKRASWIDWGMATQTQARREVLTEKMVARLSKRLASVTPALGKRGLEGSVTAELVPSISALPAPAQVPRRVAAQEASQTLIYVRPARDSLVRSAEALRLQQREIWSAAHSGASRHSRISNSTSIATVRPGRAPTTTSSTVETTKPGGRR
jgi:serine/threonine protein kinase